MLRWVRRVFRTLAPNANMCGIVPPRIIDRLIDSSVHESDQVFLCGCLLVLFCFFFVADYSRWFAACKSASTACSKVRPGPEKRWHCSAPAWPGRGGKPVGHTKTLFSLIQFSSWCTALYSRRWGFAVFFLLRFGSSFLDLIKSCQVSLDLALLGFGRALSRFMGLGLNVT